MAVTVEVKGMEGKALMPLRYVAQTFLDQTLDQIQRNLEVQHVWPTEIYPGFAAINEIRRRRAGGNHANGWFADGEGAKSFEGTLISADEQTGFVTMTTEQIENPWSSWASDLMGSLFGQDKKTVEVYDDKIVYNDMTQRYW